MPVLKRKPREESKDKSTQLVEISEGFACASQVDAQRGQAIIESIKEMIGEIENHHNPIIQKAHETHKAACAAKKRLLAPLEAAMSHIKSVTNRWIQSERKKAEEEAARQRAIQMEEERKRREAEAKKAEKAAKKNGTDDKVTPLFPDPPEPPPFIPPDVPDFKGAGIKTRVSWEWEVESIRTLCLAIANGEASADLVDVNRSIVNAIVRQKGANHGIPGIVARQVEKI